MEPSIKEKFSKDELAFIDESISEIGVKYGAIYIDFYKDVGLILDERTLRKMLRMIEQQKRNK
jgi:hypothetical protein